MEALGFHYIIEASECNPEILANPAKLKEIILKAAKIAKMDVRITHFYKFSPTGVSGMVVVTGSHISIHTWPENKYAAIDIYICGTSTYPEKAIDYILENIEAKYAHITEIERGVKDNDTYTHTILTWDEFYERDNED